MTAGRSVRAFGLVVGPSIQGATAVDGSGFRVGAGGRMMDRALINIDLLLGKFAGEPR